LTERDVPTAFILQCIGNRNDIGEVLQGTEFCEGLPAWVKALQESLQILEHLHL
jgi:hypothetical protein